MYLRSVVGNFPTVQWLGLRTFTAEGLGSTPGRETKVPQDVWCSRKKKNVVKEDASRLFQILNE